MSSRDYWFCKIVLETGKVYKSSGVYLGDRYVLTTASKLLDPNSPYDLKVLEKSAADDPFQQFQVIMGLDSSDIAVFTYNVEEITVHPDFSKDFVEYRNSDNEYVSTITNYSNDLAILKLELSPSFNGFSGISLLPTDMVSDVFQAGTVVSAIGMEHELFDYDYLDGYLISNFQTTDIVQVPDVPVIISSDEVYILKDLLVTEYPMTIKSSTTDNSWTSLFKTHSAQYIGQDVTFNPNIIFVGTTYLPSFTYTNLPYYNYDPYKNTNNDSSDVIATHQVMLNSDWYSYWNDQWNTDEIIIAQANYYDSLGATGLDTASDLAYEMSRKIFLENNTAFRLPASTQITTLNSDYTFNNKFYAANYGSDQIVTSDVGLLSFNIGSPLIYTGSDGSNYLLGLYSLGANNDIDETVEINPTGLPGIFTDLIQYRTWISENSISQYEFNDSDVINNYAIITANNTSYSTNVTNMSSNTHIPVSGVDSFYDFFPAIWFDDILQLTSDLNCLSQSDLIIFSQDITNLQSILDIFSSDGSSDYTLTSDLLVNINTYQSDIEVLLYDNTNFLNPSYPNLDGDSTTGGLYDIISDALDNVTDAQQLWDKSPPSSNFLYVPTTTLIDSFQEDVDTFYSSLAGINNTIIENVNTNAPETFRDSNYRLRVSNPTVIFDSHSFYDPYNDSGRDEQFDVKILGDGANISHNQEKAYHALSVTEDEDCSIRQTSRYVPDLIGQSKLIYLAGVLCTSSTGITSVVSKIGIFNDDNGYYVRLDGDGIHVCQLSHNVELKISQANWNLDAMDGNGTSGLDFSSYPVANGNVPQLVDLKYQHLIIVIDTQYTGLAKIGFVLNGITRFVHQFAHEHYKYAPIHSSRTPLRYQIEKVDANNNSVISEMRMTWCSITLDGPYQPHFDHFTYTNARAAEIEITPSITGLEDGFLAPVCTLRLKSQFLEAAFKIKRLQLVLSTENEIYWELIKNASVEGATWGVIGKSGSMVEIDNTATKFEKGYAIKEGLLTNGEIGNYIFIKDVGDYVTENSIAVNIDGEADTISLAVKKLSGKNPPKLWFIIEWVEMY